MTTPVSTAGRLTNCAICSCKFGKNFNTTKWNHPSWGVFGHKKVENIFRVTWFYPNFFSRNRHFLFDNTLLLLSHTWQPKAHLKPCVYLWWEEYHKRSCDLVPRLLCFCHACMLCLTRMWVLVKWTQGDLIQGSLVLHPPDLSTVPSHLTTTGFIFQFYIVWSNVIR